MKLRHLAGNIGVLCITLLILLLIMEVFLRVSFIQPMNIVQPSIHQASNIDGLVYELKPNIDTDGYGLEHIETNSQGFRSGERDPAKPVIAVVGDSYVFGHGVNNHETNPSYLQQEFPELYVLNAGVDGYNIEQQALTMQHKVTPLNPELVVVEFVFNDMVPKGFVNDDGTINVGVGTQEDQDKAMKEAITQKGLINFPGKYFLQKNSAVFNFIERTTKGLPFRKKTVDTTDPITADQLEFYKQWFIALDDAVQTKKKIFMIWPESNEHIESRAFLKQLAEERGYIVIDLYNSLGNGYAHLGWDYHPQARVHKEVATLIAKIVREKGLL